MSALHGGAWVPHVTSQRPRLSKVMCLDEVNEPEHQHHAVCRSTSLQQLEVLGESVFSVLSSSTNRSLSRTGRCLWSGAVTRTPSGERLLRTVPERLTMSRKEYEELIQALQEAAKVSGR
jgi:hypothetical protein